MTGFPAQARILGATFEVKQLALSGDAGCSNAAYRNIVIDPTLGMDVQVETYYHEVAHMWLKITGIAHALGEEHEEMVAQAIGYALSRFIADNPHLPGGLE